MKNQVLASVSTEQGKWYLINGVVETGEREWFAREALALTMQMPDDGVREFNLEFSLNGAEPGQVKVDAGVACLIVDCGPTRSLMVQPAGCDMSYRYACPEMVADTIEVKIRLAPDGYQVLLNGKRVLEIPNPFPERDIVSVLLCLPTGWRGVPPRAAWEQPGRSSAQKPLKSKFDFHVAVDFYDDLIYGDAPYTPRTFDNLMAAHAAAGASRVYWIYCGEDRHGWWDNMDINQQCFPGLVEKVRQTRRNVPNWLAQAVASAHKHGMECYAIIKPFDMGIGGMFFDEDAPARLRRTRVIGGWAYWTTDLIVRHPELREERFLTGIDPEDSRAIAQIRLIKDDSRDTAIDPEHVELYVSDDNSRYCRYEGPLSVSVTTESLPGFNNAATPANRRLIEPPAPRRVITLCVNVPQKYLVLRAGRACSFGNRLHQLVELLDSAGNPVPFEYGFSSVVKKKDGFAEGVSFCVPGALPSNSGALAFIDGAGGFVGLARGKERYITGFPFIGYPVVEKYMFQLMEECLEAGVDGIDWRDGNHNRSFNWSAYGFQEPVRAAFRERYNLDICADAFNQEDLRRVRGEFYTEFLRRTRRRLRAAGKSQQAHVSPHFEVSDPRGCLRMSNEIFLDWPTWLQEGLLDSVTLKIHEGLRPLADNQRTVIAAAHEHGVPVYGCHYLNGTLQYPARTARYRGFLDSYRAEGVDGNIMYENAAMLHARADGTFENLAPDYFDIVRRHLR